MPSRMRQDREIDRTATKAETHIFFTALGIAALIGLLIGIVWVIAGILHFHPLW
jgi:ElaB/YqjD/DUF883 family membrane-anchored ribosome-binding protein